MVPSNFPPSNSDAAHKMHFGNRTSRHVSHRTLTSLVESLHLSSNHYISHQIITSPIKSARLYQYGLHKRYLVYCTVNSASVVLPAI